ncbi:MAG: TetR/AcrR family transcriptional regulator [Myxococcota bacterium]|nr:TetR/AcrR family transcriptional regulator [Myxococcota bacterium]
MDSAASLESATPSSRDKILDVAEERFARRGYAGVGVRELAEAAGLSKSSLFHHFRSKDVLYLAVLDRIFDRIERHIGPALSGAGSSLERVERAIDGLIDAMAEHPTTPRLVLRSLFEDDDLPEDEPANEMISKRLDALIEGFSELLTRGIESGEFRPVEPRHAIQTLIGATVFHFASGEFGEALIGTPLFAADAVAERKREVKSLIHSGLNRSGSAQETPR